MKTIAQAQLDNAATYRCIEPRCTARTKRAGLTSVGSNAGLGCIMDTNMKIRCKCDRLRWRCPGEGATGCDLEDLSCGRAMPLPNFRTVSAFPERTYRRMWAPCGTPLYPMEKEHPRERAARIEWWWRIVDAGLVVCLVAILATIAFKFCKIKGWL